MNTSNTDIVPVANTPIAPLVADQLPSDARSDYEFVRANYYDIMSKGSLALDRLVEIADSSQNRSDYRVVGELIAALTATNEKLLDMHTKKRALGQDMEKPGTTQVNIDKAVFTSADLLNAVLENTKQ